MKDECKMTKVGCEISSTVVLLTYPFYPIPPNLLGGINSSWHGKVCLFFFFLREKSRII